MFAVAKAVLSRKEVDVASQGNLVRNRNAKMQCPSCKSIHVRAPHSEEACWDKVRLSFRPRLMKTNVAAV